MAELGEHGRICRRSDRRFRPVLDHASAGSVPLEERQLLSAVAIAGKEAGHKSAHFSARAARESQRAAAEHAPKRLTPAAEINKQYSAFLTAFNEQLDNYVASLSQESTGAVTVSSTVTAAYTPPSPIIEVSDASVFGPAGTFAAPVVATATLGSAPPLGQFVLTGSRRKHPHHRRGGIGPDLLALGDRSDGERPHVRSNQRHVDLPQLHHQ